MKEQILLKLKKFLPFIIVIALVFLIAPAFLVSARTDKYNSFVYIGVFSITTFLCAFFYGYKNGKDYFFSAIAPLIYLPSMFLYGNYKDSIFNCLIYFVCYFLCGFIGVLVGDLGYSDKKNKSRKQSQRRSSIDVENKGGREEISPRRREAVKTQQPARRTSRKENKDEDFLYKYDAPAKKEEEPKYDFEKSADDEINEILRQLHGDEN